MSDKPKFKIERPGYIVILDQQWHKLFEGRKPFRIIQLERKLNKLLQEQGKVNTEYDAYKKIKKQMMDEIVASMNDSSMNASEQKAKNSRYIKDINRKFEKFEERKSQLPSEIEALNSELLTKSMIFFYKRLMDNKKTSQNLANEIEIMKTSLKEKVGIHEDMEQEVTQLYTFMHDIAGFEAIEALDRHYFGGEK